MLGLKACPTRPGLVRLSCDPWWANHAPVDGFQIYIHIVSNSSIQWVIDKNVITLWRIWRSWSGTSGRSWRGWIGGWIWSKYSVCIYKNFQRMNDKIFFKMTHNPLWFSIFFPNTPLLLSYPPVSPFLSSSIPHPPLLPFLKWNFPNYLRLALNLLCGPNSSNSWFSCLSLPMLRLDVYTTTPGFSIGLRILSSLNL